MTPQEFLWLSVEWAFWMVMAGVVFAFVRLAIGPSLPDRVVALDMMTVLIAAFCGLYAMLTGEEAFLDVAIVLALIGFLATVAFARFAERRVTRAEEDAAETAKLVASKMGGTGSVTEGSE
jgi:multicomponent Na+:H+ antiporter subunit F